MLCSHPVLVVQYSSTHSPPVGVSRPAAAAVGFQLTRDSAPFATAVPSTSINDFVPPTLCSSIQMQPSGRALALQFYAVPTMPGGCLLPCMPAVLSLGVHTCVVDGMRLSASSRGLKLCPVSALLLTQGCHVTDRPSMAEADRLRTRHGTA